MTMLRRTTLLLACLGATLLAGCGFHPRAELVLPAGLGPVVVVSGDPYSPLGGNLARALTRAGAAGQSSAAGCANAAGPGCAGTGGAPVSASVVPGTANLRIVSEAWVEGPLTIDSFSHVREYVITLTVTFAFTAADGTDLVPLQEVVLQRDFTYDDSHALGSSEEQATIREEMQRDMAASILRRIGIALRNRPS